MTQPETSAPGETAPVEQTWTFVGHWESSRIVVEYVLPGEQQDTREDTRYWDEGLFAGHGTAATQAEALQKVRDEYEAEYRYDEDEGGDFESNPHQVNGHVPVSALAYSDATVKLAAEALCVADGEHPENWDAYAVDAKSALDAMDGTVTRALLEQMREDAARWVADATVSAGRDVIRPAFTDGGRTADSIRCGGYESDGVKAALVVAADVLVGDGFKVVPTTSLTGEHRHRASRRVGPTHRLNQDCAVVAAPFEASVTEPSEHVAQLFTYEQMLDKLDRLEQKVNRVFALVQGAERDLAASVSRTHDGQPMSGLVSAEKIRDALADTPVPAPTHKNPQEASDDRTDT